MEADLKELKSRFTALEERCQVAESVRESKEQELTELVGKLPPLEAALEVKEKDLQVALVERAVSEHLLGLVMDDSGHLNLNFVRRICEKFVHTTHMQSMFYHWMVIVMREVIRSLVSNF